MPDAAPVVVGPRDPGPDARGGDGPPSCPHRTRRRRRGRWLTFHERLAEHFAWLLPSSPGHGGSPAAEWIEHISDLAFHYLDLLDELGLDRVHLVGASFGGWIAAEMADHGLASARLADAHRSGGHQGRRLDLSVPVRDGHPGARGDGVPRPDGGAGARASRPVRRHPGAAVPRRGRPSPASSWNPYLYNPLLRRRLGRIRRRTLLCWGAHDRLAPPAPCGKTWADGDPRRRLARVRRLAATCRTSRSPTRSPRKRSSSSAWHAATRCSTHVRGTR